MPQLLTFDHIVLTVRSIEETVAFYERVLAMRADRFEAADGSTRIALHFGAHKINLHEAGSEFEPKAQAPSPGSSDLCFLTPTPLSDWCAHLEEAGVSIESGPVVRSGAMGPLTSVYIRDPDGNLLEISNPA